VATDYTEHTRFRNSHSLTPGSTEPNKKNGNACLEKCGYLPSGLLQWDIARVQLHIASKYSTGKIVMTISWIKTELDSLPPEQCTITKRRLKANFIYFQ
jgi:hypothetical protein